MAVDLQELARSMLADYDARTPGRLFTEPLALTVLQAYDLQEEIARLREERGEKVIGYKVGCTSPADTSERGALHCDDGLDNDGDYGVDFAPGSTLDDPSCASASAANERTQCSDGVDNDNDGKYDWNGAGVGAADPQCGGANGASKNKEASGCGIGFELALLLPLLARRRRAA